ncbi:MAG TPA: hypothetical protein VNA65_04075, partial [Candidatus Dormibacteraeota bacterium]|nr:hypothetical protein [Candidatus Dormibacteraeota bacterium]
MTCTDHRPGTNSLLVGPGGEFGDSAVYDVSDPITPRLLCRIQHSSAQLSGALNFQYLDPRQDGSTDVVNHFSDGSEARNFVLPVTVNTAAWASTGALAYTIPLSSHGSCPAGATQVWIYQGSASTLLYTYCNGFGDCICRFGLPAPVLAISPDGQYLVSGWLAGKGSEPMAVYRLADRVRIATLPGDVAR